VAPREPVAREVPAPAAANAPREPERVMRVEGQLGSIEPAAVDAVFDRELSALLKCHAARVRQLRALAGDVKVVLRIGEDGRARYAYVEDTSLGDHVTEQCILHVLSEAAWPRPVGGEAEVRKSFGFVAPGAPRSPVPWTLEDVKEAVGPSQTKIRTCRAGVTGVFTATAYITAGAPVVKSPEHHKPPRKKPSPQKHAKKTKPTPAGGHIVAVGIAAPGPDGVAAIDCLVETLKETPMPNPGPRGAKVTWAL
jgi:hypothetical protein